MRISDWSSDVCSSDLDCISTIRSPATRVSLSVDLSRAPVGYLAADGPVERTTIDCAAAAVTMVRAATTAAAVRPMRRIRKSGKDIAFSLFGQIGRAHV